MTPWLAIVGIGEGGLPDLGAAARSLVDRAEVLVGDERVLAMVPEDGRTRLHWPRPLKALLPEIERRRGRPVCVLASGDPLHFSVGEMIARHFPADELAILPAPSAFSLACARLGWSRAGTETISLHGPPLEVLNAVLHPGGRVIALTRNGRTPAEAAALLRARGWGASRLTALERLGGPQERVVSATADDWAEEEVDHLNTLAIECIAGPEAVVRSRCPGLPDAAFRSDGKLTKREVRAATLAALAPLPGETLWDVGAGSGSISIEWLRLAPRARAVAIEKEEPRLSMIAANAAALGVPELRVVAGEAPGALEGLETPDAVFIGGGLTAPGLVDACWAALRPGGRIVANTVTTEGEAVLLDRQARLGGSLTRIAVSRIKPVGTLTGWEPLMPVTQWTAVRP